MNRFISRLSRAVAATALALPLAWPAHAALIDAGAAAPGDTAAAQPASERDKVRQFLDRASVRDRLQSLGVDGLAAGARVDALTDAEVHALAERIDALPAGGRFSEMDIILILLVALLIVVVL